MKNKTKAIVITSLIGLVLVYFTYSSFGFGEVIKGFKNFTLDVLIFYLVAVVLIEILLSLRWYVVLRAFNLKVPLLNTYLYKMSGYCVGYLSPQAHIGGEPIRALLLKRHGIDFKTGISTVLIDKSMQVTTDLLFALVGAVLLFLHFSISRKLGFLVFGFIALSVGFLISYFYCMITKKPFFSAILGLRIFKKSKRMVTLKKHILEIEHTIHGFYIEHYKAFIIVIFINIALYLLMITEYSAAIKLFGFTPSFYAVFIIMGGVALSYSFPVPMALGVLELSQVNALGLLNLDKAIGLSISILIRIKDILRSLIGGISLFYFGLSTDLIWKQIKGKNGKESS